MNRPLTIGKLAQEAGVPVSTIRFYEREGLLEPDRRSSGNYRQYGRESLERLRFMKAAQASGLTLSDIRALLACRDEGASACHDVQSLLEQRLAKVDEQLTHLNEVRSTLAMWIEECRQRASGGSCAFLGGLDEQAQKGDSQEN